MHIAACRPWLDAEIEAVKPRVVVCLGATAAQALLGRTFKVTQRRGELISSDIAPYLLATVHPSSILRAPDEESRHEEMARFIDDLRNVSHALEKKKAA
jgi:DNA polymerase